MIIINKVWKENVVEYGLQMVPNYWTPKFTKLSVVLMKLMVLGNREYLHLEANSSPKETKGKGNVSPFPY